MDRRRHRSICFALSLLASFGSGCDDGEQVDAGDSDPIEVNGADVPAQAQLDTVQTPAHDEQDFNRRGVSDSGGVAVAGDEEATRNGEVPPPEPVIERRNARRAMMVYAEPDFSAGFRGKIPRGEVFDVVELVEGGADCDGDGWGRLGVHAYACLERTVVSEAMPRALPIVRPGRLMPFYYARRRKTGEAPSRWKSRAALGRGDEPTGVLDLDHDYAFVHRKRRRSGNILTDRGFGAVREADVRRLKPSAFEGRDLTRAPVDEGKSLAWIVAWPYAEGFPEPNDTEKRAAKFEFQSQLYVHPEPVSRGRSTYYQVDDESPDARWIEAKQIRRWLPAAPPAGVGEEQRWLDVELTQQTLTIMRGSRPEFTTLISSGSHKHPTPVGLHRMTSKHGYGDMRSRADEDEPYHVEAVPWIMYFKGRYALHGAFWHNRFGSRMSHGCINLSASDARRVFETTAPSTPGGWVTVYEAPGDEGTLLRIRKADETPPDQRKPPRRHRPPSGSSRK